MASNGNSFNYNAIDFGETSNYNLWVVSHNMPSIAQPRLYMMNLSGAHGSVSFSSFYEPMYFNLDCIVLATNEENRKIQVGNVISQLKNTIVGEKSFTLDDDPDSGVYNVRLVNGVDLTLAINGAQFPLTFVAPDPIPT